ncbi:MAG: M3 family metallopeptidase [Coxiellaceae bacterium]|nr:M3 family metallopeptidase [Coxiellaceae bacterium]
MQASLPAFKHISIESTEKNLDHLLKHNLEIIDQLCEQKNFTWDNLMRPIENLTDQLHQLWSPIQHLSAVVNSQQLRAVMNACLPKLSDYHTHLGHHEKLFRAMESLKNSAEFETLSQAQKMAIDHELRDFKLNGIALSPEKKTRFAELSKALSQESHKFEENVLDATMAFKKNILDEKLVSGIPEHAKNAAKAAAKKENLDGYLFTLEAPSYIAVMTFADSAALRHEMYYAFVTRASDIGPNAKQFDNSELMKSIIRNRFELAKLLGFNNFAEYSLATKMVKSTDEVLTFLKALAKKSYSQGKKELSDLADFAKNHLHMPILNPWDIAYAAEKLRQQAYAFSPEELRPYFPENKVLPGLFDIIHRLYDLTAEKITLETWHNDVKCFLLKDKNNNPVAYLLMDLYARTNKRGGAWMDECAIRRRLDNGDIQLPAAYVTCNFNAPVGDQPALFSHDDVVTLFHECGHALQHMLTKIETGYVSGIRGIPWDAVEVASQFFENWAWEKSSIDYFAKHVETNALIPDELFQRMDRAKNFQSAMQMMRQLEFSLFDFRMHMEFNGDNIQAILDDVRKEFAVVPIADFNRFQHGFTHIFGGGYAAGYYSYKWAEVMACDAFSVFEEKGVFDHDSSEKFKTTFLESGGSVEPMDLFIAFRGRKPSVAPLLKQSGIVV